MSAPCRCPRYRCSCLQRHCSPFSAKIAVCVFPQLACFIRVPASAVTRVGWARDFVSPCPRPPSSFRPHVYTLNKRKQKKTCDSKQCVRVCVRACDGGDAHGCEARNRSKPCHDTYAYGLQRPLFGESHIRQGVVKSVGWGYDSLASTRRGRSTAVNQIVHEPRHGSSRPRKIVG